MNSPLTLFAGLTACILFTVLVGVVGIDGIDGSKESTKESMNRDWSHSPAFILGNTFGSVVPIESLRGEGGGARGGGGGGGRGEGGGGGIGEGGGDGIGDGNGGSGFTSPRKRRPRGGVFSRNKNSALKFPFVSMGLLVFLLLFSIFFNNMS